jgi:hypothetical protein
MALPAGWPLSPGIQSTITRCGRILLQEQKIEHAYVVTSIVSWRRTGAVGRSAVGAKVPPQTQIGRSRSIRNVVAASSRTGASPACSDPAIHHHEGHYYYDHCRRGRSLTARRPPDDGIRLSIVGRCHQ